MLFLVSLLDKRLDSSTNPFLLGVMQRVFHAGGLFLLLPATPYLTAFQGHVADWLRPFSPSLTNVYDEDSATKQHTMKYIGSQRSYSQNSCYLQENVFIYNKIAIKLYSMILLWQPGQPKLEFPDQLRICP